MIKSYPFSFFSTKLVYKGWMYMYNISNFIALGGCCLSVYVLGPERIKGPVDNVLLFNKNSLELLLNNKYYSYIKHHDPIRSKKANIVP